jgi:hypothetical protein
MMFHHLRLEGLADVPQMLVPSGIRGLSEVLMDERVHLLKGLLGNF